MIVFDLICRAGGETFEAWFASGAAFDEQSARGLVVCPFCGSNEVKKAPMAPSLSRKSSQANLAEYQSAVLQDSRWVGDQFADVARAMHAGEVAPEKLHGRATLGDAKSLFEDGVPILPLPLPVVPPEQVN
jgi:hypothetical protein